MQLTKYSCGCRRIFRSRSILDLLTLRIGGMSHRLIYGVRHRLEQCRYDFVFLSSSLLGELAEK